MKKALLFFFFLLSFQLINGAGYFSIPNPGEDGVRPVVYPNPASDFIHLSNNALVRQLVIYNFSGRQVLTFKASEGRKYNISELPTGMYLVQFLDGQKRILHTQRLHKR